MHHFDYRNGFLHAEDVPLARLADEIGTPLYCYSTATLERHYRVFAKAFAGTNALVCYALKANSNQAVIATLARQGAGMDIVSGGELLRALKAGTPPGRIVFSGVGKTKDEMAAALRAGILCFNLESEPEMRALAEVAASLGVRAPVSVRVNPDVDALTHAKISTGKSENKFGIPISRALEVYREAASLPSLRVVGVDMHIGSQITDLQPYGRAARLLVELARALLAEGHELEHIDFGGGLGIPYRLDDPPPPDPQAFAAVIREAMGDLPLRPVFEIGRMISGNAGILLTRVVYVKEGEDRSFAIVDAAMNDLIRPTLYEAHHDILTVREERAGDPRQIYDVVGPVCESGDFLAKGRTLPKLAAGDLLAVMTAGAYGAVQAGTYNTRPLVPEILVRGEEAAIVRPRQTIEEIVGMDRLPNWLPVG